MANPAVRHGFIPIANELAEKLAAVSIPSSEMRIIWAVWRKTWGWKQGNRRKDWDWVSLSQFEKMTTMKHASVVKALKSLVVKRLLLKKEKGLSFNQNYDQWVVVKRLPPVVKRLLGSSQTTTKSSSQTTTNKRKKETITKESINTTAKPRNEDIDFLINLLKEKFGLSVLDGTQQENRRYCWLAIQKLKGRENVSLILQAGLDDPFWRTKITGFKTVYYQAMKIASTKRMPQIAKIR